MAAYMLVMQPAQAETFKSAGFLKWKRETQAFYISTAIGMASLVIGQSNKSNAACIDDWYYGDEAAAEEYIFSIMREYPEHHPRGIIYAVLKKKCTL